MAFTAGYTPLHHAVLCRSSRHNKVKALLDQGASPAARTSQGDTPLHLTLASYSYMLEVGEAIRIDSRLFQFKKNPFGSQGLSHFHIACMFGDLEIVRAFLDRGVDPNLQRIRGPICTKPCNSHLWHDETCLHVATHAGRSDVVQLLLERGADPTSNASLGTPLHHARYDRHGSATKLLLEHGADVNARNCKDMTPLQVQCSSYFVFHVVKALLEAGADVNFVNRFGASALQDIIKRKGEVKDKDVQYLFKHVISLEEAGLDLSNENLKSILEFEKFDDMTVYRKLCRSELELMNQVRFDARTTLRDALRVHDPRRLQQLAAITKFGDIVADRTFSCVFPIYDRLAKLQHRRGARVVEAVLALQKLYACIAKADNGLPPECAEMVVYYLTYEDLWRVIQAAAR